MLIVKLICEECFNKKYGETPVYKYDSMLYKGTEEEIECEECGKVDYLIYITEPKDPKKCKWNFR
ncbi:MAG: hypothetical protein UHO61_01580 [Acutalibacteraceae bacterium]|nr:hypothetical protein [Acutalibacteraceae bacterium]